MADFIKTGLTPDSVKNMVFGAGVLYKNFKYGIHYRRTFDTVPQPDKEYYYMSTGSGGIGYTKLEGDSFSEGTKYYEKYEGYGGDRIGCTKGGAKAGIVPEYTDIEVDGVLVKMQGLTRKTGEKGTIEATVIDMNPVNISSAIGGEISYSGTDPLAGGTNAPFITTKPDISQNDYIDNLALAARRLDDGKLTVVIFKKALCTSGFEIETKNKETAGNKYTFEAYAEQSDVNTETLPVEIITEMTL
ncbi:MAG: hypothetical protein ACI4JB_10305 [Porcipelethomonas sp.]